MTAYIVVQFTGPRTRSPHASEFKLPEEVQEMLSRYDAQLLPPADPLGDIATATILVPDMQQATELADALREMKNVEAAYAKPGEELP